MKKKIIIGLACLIAGAGLAGCGAGGNTGGTAETKTTAEVTTTLSETTTPTETTTTTEATTATTTEVPTEAWMSEYGRAAIPPKKNPDEVWDGKYKVEVRLKNGVHIYLPSFFDSFYDGMVPYGNFGYGIATDEFEYNTLDYSRFEDGKIYYGNDYFETDVSFVRIGVHEEVVKITSVVSDNMPEEDGIHRYKRIGEKDGKVYYLDFTPPYFGNGQTPQWHDGDATNPGYFTEYADMIADTAWVEKTSVTSSVESAAHPEDDSFKEYLRKYYTEHEKNGGYPVTDEAHKSYEGYYEKYAIADFDADGVNELAVLCNITWTRHFDEGFPAIEIYKSYKTDFNDASAMFKQLLKMYFDDVTFYNNGVAEGSSTAIDPEKLNGEVIDNKVYFLLNDNLLGKLNYSMENVGNYTGSVLLYYYKEDGVIHKTLTGLAGKDLDVIKTREDYDNDMAILHSGKVMDIEIKDFTAENLGL